MTNSCFGRFVLALLLLTVTACSASVEPEIEEPEEEEPIPTFNLPVDSALAYLVSETFSSRHPWYNVTWNVTDTIYFDPQTGEEADFSEDWTMVKIIAYGEPSEIMEHNPIGFMLNRITPSSEIVFERDAFYCFEVWDEEIEAWVISNYRGGYTRCHFLDRIHTHP